MTENKVGLKELTDLIPTRMNLIPPAMNRSWRVIVERADGTLEEITGFSRLTAIDPRFARITIGEHPNGGYDTWAKHEFGGGGSVTIPFVRIDGEIYVGLLLEKRLLQTKDGLVWNAIMGYLEPDMSHFETAKNEFAEETGITPAEERLRLLPGEAGNHDNSNCETWGKRPSEEPEGVRFFSYKFSKEELEPSGDKRWKPKAALNPKESTGEKILKCEFIPWREAVALVGDMQTLSAIARLIAEELR